MTETKIYSIFDTKAQLFLDFWKSTNSDTAMREFAVAVNGEGIIARFPEDYVLFEIGEFIYKEGKLVPFDPTTSICKGISLVMHDDPMPGHTGQRHPLALAEKGTN